MKNKELKLKRIPNRNKQILRNQTLEENKTLLNRAMSWLKSTFGYTGLEPAVERRVNQLIQEMKDRGYDVMVFEGYRSPERQNKLYAQGRTQPGAIVTNARAGESFHNYGVAVDIVFKGDSPWSPKHPWELLGQVGKSLGFTWGGDWKFKDLPHFELTFNHKLSDFQTGNVDYFLYV